jgi:hypothetical protein
MDKEKGKIEIELYYIPYRTSLNPRSTWPSVIRLISERSSSVIGLFSFRNPINNPNFAFQSFFIMTQPGRALTRALLQDLHTWWLKDVPAQYDMPMPASAMKRWFMKSDEVDEICWSV